VDATHGDLVTAAGNLDELVHQTFGADAASVTIRPFRYATTHAMTEVDVILADGSRRALLLKNLGVDQRLPEAKGNRPGFLDDPGREIHVYQSALGGLPGIPTCFASQADERAGVWWLLIEKVPGVELWQIGELEAWCEVARWAAGLHQRPDRVDDDVLTRLVSYDRAFFEHWPRRARRFAERWGRGRCRKLAEALRGYDQIIDALVQLPRCFVHGELYPSNVLVDQATGRISAVDWEMAGLGTGMLDLSSLVAGSWSDTERFTLVTAYHAALPLGNRPPVEQLVEDLMRCELHRCIQWLGWAPNWEPPSEHRQDWLEVAISLAERVRRQ
jgi:aminoglycoside phosphotransferase (APT) family kinase protein